MDQLPPPNLMENVNNLHVSCPATNSTPCTDQDIALHHVNSNSFPFIFRLPTETLQAIFIRGASDYYYGEDHGFTIRIPPSWIIVSYVCRHWRSVALNCPTLWSFLFVVSKRWTEELLSRSKQAPLRLHVAENFLVLGELPVVMTFLGQVANHTERIQELDLFLNVLPSEQKFSKLFSHARLLQTLRIRVDYLLERDWPPSMSLDTPALRTLDVVGNAIPWTSFTLSGVTNLSLNHFHPRFQQSIEQFIATLSHMRYLSHLHLDSVLPSAAGFLSSSAFRNFHNIDLPCLFRLSITASLSTIVALLSCINIPLQTEIRLCYYSEPTADDTLLSPLLARRFGPSDALSSPTIRSLSINFEDHEPGDAMISVSFSVHDCHPQCCSMEESWEAGIPLQIVTDRSESMVNDENRIMAILCSVPLMNVHSICVLRPSISSRFWRELLGHFPNLRYLQLVGGHLPDIAPALSFVPSTDDQGEHLDRPQMLVPKLETLSLFCISVGGDSLDSDVTPPDQPAADLQTLIDALASRESPGQLTTDLSSPPKVIGRWGGGHFQFPEEE